MSQRHRGLIRPFAFLALALAVLSTSLDAQYFGRNKVQYEDFDFKVLKTENFDIYYYPREEKAAAQAARLAERWLTRLSRVLQHDLSGRQPLILYATPVEFQQTNAVGGDIGEGTGGLTEALRRRIVLPVGGTLGDLDHVLGHELVHAFQYDMTGTGRPTSLGALPGASALPLWFIEGMAEYLSLGPVHAQTAMWMRGALRDTTADSLPTLRDLEDPRYFPYRYGHAFLAYVAGRWGEPVIGQLLRQAGRRRGVEPAIRAVLGLPPEVVVAGWHQALREAYNPLLSETRAADQFGQRIIGAEGDNRYNIAPSLSPDGSQVMFLSDRDLFSIDLFLADARTGKIKRQITKTALDPHLQSLEFIESAGSWSPDGRRFVLSGISGGKPLLSIYDVDKGETIREIKFDTLGQILNPSWSPDGGAIAFSGIRDGLSDLFIYDIESDQLRQLMDDQYADLQPVWSPDGGTLAFATDRYSTDLVTLKIGKYSLALLDVETGRIQQIPGGGEGRRFNPQWAPDGRSLFFLGDPDGITNVYRLDLASNQLTQLTDLYTGVSGITEISPAMSVAARTGRLMYSVFRANGLDLFAIDDPTSIGDEPAVAYLAYGQSSVPVAAVLPPAARRDDEVFQLLHTAEVGLPDRTEFPVRPYDPDLSLTYVGRPSLIAGTSQFGTFIGGGASLYWSDVLGNHNLVTALQVEGSLKDLNAVVEYHDLSNRWNWGLGAQQTSYRTGRFAEGTTTIDGQPALVRQELIRRQISRDAYTQVSYPFSEVQRVEFSGGFSYVSFDLERRTQAISLISGDQIFDDTEDLPAGESLALGIGSAALVYDNSFFGATSPILGQRYRLEVAPTIGSIAYFGVLADYRKYFMPARPFTFATRLLHYGRYGSDAEDPRLQSLFLGWPGLVRGYSLGSFDASECRPGPDDPEACPVFDQLLGSRLAVASAELRFPLLGVLGIGSGYYGAFPIEFAVFGDAGLAWDSENEPSIFGSGVRDPVYSAGFGLRVNLLGFAVAEIDLVRPFDRPGKGWVWQFELQPGF